MNGALLISIWGQVNYERRERKWENCGLKDRRREQDVYLTWTEKLRKRTRQQITNLDLCRLCYNKEKRQPNETKNLEEWPIRGLEWRYGGCVTGSVIGTFIFVKKICKKVNLKKEFFLEWEESWIWNTKNHGNRMLKERNDWTIRHCVFLGCRDGCENRRGLVMFRYVN